jgi:NAD(P)-dependent dehydrogenase (short-subunit alcohol dehydrogenase family)
MGASYVIGRVIAITYTKAGASVIALAACSDFGDFEKEFQDTAITTGRSPPKVPIHQLDVTNSYGFEEAV